MLVQRMRSAALAFLASLEQPQRARATASFDSPDHRTWTYLPGPRPGLPLAAMTDGQIELAMGLLNAGLSAAGAGVARDVMELDSVLRELEHRQGRGGWERRGRDNYWVRVLGDPAPDGTWAWRVNGHHLAVHLTVVGDAVAGTPQFYGANPAVVLGGPRAGWQPLRTEEQLARELVVALPEDQRAVAVVSDTAPSDIATRDDPVADPRVVPHGLRCGDMEPSDQRRLTGLVRHYLGRVAPEVADAAWAGIVDAGLTEVAFAWAGSLVPREGHYYAIAGPTVLIEYDNTQDGANHVHTVWRDLRRDWGTDLLAAHHAVAH